ncbi:MAG: hypothetical protein ACYDAC_07730 [Candidatus Dormibacteria bacterium]
MSTPTGPPPPPSDDDADLTFVSHDLGREEGASTEPLSTASFVPSVAEPPPPRPLPAFHVVSDADVDAGAGAGADDLPWVSRDAPPPSADAAENRPWSVRRTDGWVRTSTSTTRRLRQEAVNLAWSSASLAVAAAGRRRLR